jgi:hypothetical protein
MLAEFSRDKLLMVQWMKQIKTPMSVISPSIPFHDISLLKSSTGFVRWLSRYIHMKRSQKSFLAQSARWFLVLAWAQVPSRAHADILQYACGM